MLVKNKTSYLRKLENYISQKNITLSVSGAGNSSLLETKVSYEKNEFDEKRFDKDIVSVAEEIFGVKAQPISTEERKIHAHVASSALVYQVINGKPKILVYKKT